jgi:1-acyl-sn-glycerol-3-phosphate acyltransferase
MGYPDRAPNPGARALVDAIVAFLATRDLLTADEVQDALYQEVDRAGPDALTALKARLAEDDGWSFYPPDALARRIHERLAERIVTPESEVTGAHHLAVVARARVIVFANHLSYADANVIDILLRRADGAVLADRLTALAGPKVFTSRERRFSSLCFGTVKVPQSADVSSGEAVLDTREVARAARQSIDTALARLRGGDALLLFGEGTRSRTAAMQPMLAGVARYLEVPATWIVPAGLVGSERLFPLDGGRLQPSRVDLHVGRPVAAEALVGQAHGNRRAIVDAIGLAIARLLPTAYRGVYASEAAYPDARRALEQSTRD